MTILPLHPADNASPDALRSFLAQCQAAARRAERPQLVSISLAVDALDPLAVLESIFEPSEPHFYAERPAIGSAIAGAEIATAFEAHGPQRFVAVQRWMDETLENTIAVGDVGAPFGGPHFFAAFAFDDEVGSGEPFPAAYIFVPRWQVALAGTTTTAAANLLIAPDAELEPLVQRVWRAHAKFRRFDYDGGSSGPGVLSGTGVPPVSVCMGETPMPLQHQAHERDARATSEIYIRQGACLPHWTREGALYTVTFRVADSLPVHVIEAWRAERAAIDAKTFNGERPLTPYERERLIRLHSEKLDALLDHGIGACYLRRDDIASMVAGALKHFAGTRYELHEWCVMPNHVHAVVRPLGGNKLDEIVHSWKSYTAKEANRILSRQGQFWQEEYYDHLIRDESDYLHSIEYVRRNPEKAGLQNWRWRGTGMIGSSGPGVLSGTGVPPVSVCMGETPMPPQSPENPQSQAHGRDAHVTFQCSDVGDYRRAVAAGLERISTGELKKIVLARAQDVVADRPFHPLEMLNGLRQRFPDCYSFSFTCGRGPSFIGATPERLVRISHQALETEALAGSIRRGASASEDAALATALARSEKDLREQREVLDDIIARLTPLGLKPDFPTQPQVRRLANVQHLHTPIRAAVPEGVRVLDIVAAMHPTPAVGGNPRASALTRIREFEGFPRGLYAGALGWVNARGGGEFFVGIRSALVEGARARVYAGAGIVAGSTADKEFAETELKFKAMLDAFGA